MNNHILIESCNEVSQLGGYLDRYPFNETHDILHNRRDTYQLIT